MYNPNKFWNEQSSNWLSLEHDTEKQWDEISAFFNPKWKVLEMGCGNGRWSEKIPNYSGCDISEKLILNASLNHKGDFFVHDIRDGLPKGYDLYFFYTSLLHIPPKDIKNIFIDRRILMVEPFKKSNNEYCFNHNYVKLFNVREVKKLKNQVVYANYCDTNL